MEEQNPYAPPTVVAPTSAGNNNSYGPFQRTEGTAKLFQIFMGTLLFLYLVFGIICAYAGIKSATEQIDPIYDEDGAASLLGLTYFGVAVGSILFYILTIIFFCIWTNKSMKNVWAMDSYSKPEISPGWAVGFYFIPIVNLWKPFQAMKEIWSLSVPEKSSSSILGCWWALWIISCFADRISMRLPTETFEDMKFSYFFDAGSVVISIGAGLLLMNIVSQVTKKQTETQLENNAEVHS